MESKEPVFQARSFWNAVELFSKWEISQNFLALWIILEIFFPSPDFLHYIFLAVYAISFILLVYFLKFGRRRYLEEEKAHRKVPYIGSMLLMGNRSLSEKAGIYSYFFHLFLTAIIPLLNFTAILANIAKLFSIFIPI